MDTIYKPLNSSEHPELAERRSKTYSQMPRKALYRNSPDSTSTTLLITATIAAAYTSEHVKISRQQQLNASHHLKISTLDPQEGLKSNGLAAAMNAIPLQPTYPLAPWSYDVNKTPQSFNQSLVAEDKRIWSTRTDKGIAADCVQDTISVVMRWSMNKKNVNN